MGSRAQRVAPQSIVADVHIVPLDYNNPEQTYTNAINFASGDGDDDNNASGNTKATQGAGSRANDIVRNTANNIQSKMSDMLKKLNDSEFVYPTIAVLVLTITVVIVLFQKALGFFLKSILVLILLIFIAYTVFQFKNKQ